ncbi:MAG: UDP-N-acetylglucosamine 2-epimerase [Kiritimatiellia bacterium]|jgi:UDP-N-acetylglucosamine 2-epimerase (non-hydrolysing)|nr:UDP-N-acetylglucosamine 2-epimerase [Kiritimatiellia bacterium]
MSETFTIPRRVLSKVKGDDRPVHLVLIATKPDIIKQAPLILELKRREENLLIVHSGQHYDWNLSKGLEHEFDIDPDVNLDVRGATLYDQQAQIIARFGALIDRLKRINRKIIPYTYSDTTTAVAGGVASFANRIATVHVEAGLRTMSPPRRLLMGLHKGRDVVSYYQESKDRLGWEKGSYEPYPEQFDSRASAPSAGIHLVSTELNRQNLLAEGYDKHRIAVVGNPVADAISLAKKRSAESGIVEQLPRLAEGNFIRVCIHRRENVTSRHRFTSLIQAVEQLVLDGRNVLLISLGATEKALKEYGWKLRITKLAKQHPNFIYSPVWPSYIDVIASMQQTSVIATDSGSIQEEANVMGIPLVTLRFNTDRPESVFAGGNIIAPPMTSDVVHRVIREVHDNERLRSCMLLTRNIYGRNVGKKMVDVVSRIVSAGPLFDWLEHYRLGLTKLDFWEEEEIEW